MKLSEKPFITRERIDEAVKKVARQVSHDYASKELLLIAVLKGGCFFAVDLMQQLTVPVTIDFIRARSYEGTLSKGTIEFSLLPQEKTTGKHVLIVEDILDTGRTVAAIFDRLKVQEPASIKVCSFLDKPSCRAVEIPAGYTAITIDDHFVVGYGLDYNEKYRELSEIYVLEGVTL